MPRGDVFGQIELWPDGWAGSYLKSSFMIDAKEMERVLAQIPEDRDDREKVLAAAMTSQAMSIMSKAALNGWFTYLMEEKTRKLMIPELLEGVAEVNLWSQGVFVRKAVVVTKYKKMPKVIMYGRRMFLREDLDGFESNKYNEMGIDDPSSEFFTYFKP